MAERGYRAGEGIRLEGRASGRLYKAMGFIGAMSFVALAGCGNFGRS
jgi:hypothetical protein